MRNLAAHLVLWLCRTFDIKPLAEARLAMGSDVIARSERWEQFYLEEGGIADLIAALRMEAFEAAAETPPEDVAKLQYWAMADRNVRRLDARIRGIIMSGKIEVRRDETIQRQRAATIRKSVI